MTDSQTRKQASAEPQRLPELCYAYYLRCHHFRSNGQQCKAPALKGGTLCYKHDAQVATAARREQSVRALGLPERLIEPQKRLQALSTIMQALLKGTIDRRTAGRLLIKVQGG